jgi:sterol desaturase/sphingolipid hydroxylase (fatty acid hydroxylase superfamily)
MDSSEVKLVKEAETANSQWKIPSVSSIGQGVFLTDHYTWMWRPSSLFLVGLCYLIVKYTETHYGDDGLPVALILPSILLYWIFGLGFIALDFFTNQKGKTFVTRTSVPLKKMIPIVAKNHFLAMIVFPPLAWIGYHILSPFPALKLSDDSLIWIIWSYFINGLVFEVVFWVGHYLEHLSPDLYRKFHLLHHTTKADIALSGYYMTFVDYCFEGLIPFYACLLVTARLQLSTVALASKIMLNTVYATTAHSGWSIPGFPDPGDHWEKRLIPVFMWL